MEESKSESKDYEFDGFIDIDMTPKAEVSLFERKIRNTDTIDDPANTTDESWAEMLIEDEDDDTPQLGVLKPKTDEQLADDELYASGAVNTEQEKNNAAPQQPTPKPAAPGLIFSLVGEKEARDAEHHVPPRARNAAAAKTRGHQQGDRQQQRVRHRIGQGHQVQTEVFRLDAFQIDVDRQRGRSQ